MNQFKDVFLGVGSRPYTRAVDSQKCMRVSGKHNDLEDVGKSPYHHTFFEMLGNWSFGDYYKKEAIQWAWELLTDRWGLPKDELFATVFEDDRGDLGRDQEASDCWLSVTDVQPDHVLYFGRKDNFWEMGESGPCGPCSEIHLDRGQAFCDLSDVPGHTCRVNGDCRRFLEVWNLVFIQYNRHVDGKLDALPAKHVDTGMGFERMVAILQGAHSNYETDLFSGTMSRTQALLGHTDAQRRADPVAYRVIADHARASSFLIADGALPGNLGRGYVLRMIIRRAARFGKRLGFREPFLAQLAEQVIGEMGGFFGELVDRRELVLQTLTTEEERFQRTLDAAMSQLEEVIAELQATGQRTIDGETAFHLYATFGLPLEITRDVVQERGFTVDESDFRAASEKHKQASGTGAFGALNAEETGVYVRLLAELVDRGVLSASGVDHDPHGQLVQHANVVALVMDGHVVDSAETGAEVEVVLDSTPFYAESGGQVGDSGTIRQPDGWLIEVADVQKPLPALVVHRGRVVRGQIRTGEAALAVVDAERRWDIMRNHTATHLLHQELREVLGRHVLQQGSLVAPDRFRFDFNHPTLVQRSELDAMEQRVNQVILRNLPVAAGHASLRHAKEQGAMALFGEKYGEVVRTIQVGEPSHPYSLELCGGTHVNQTAEIGLFHIVSEGSVGANVRRIEAVTGRAAQALAHEQFRVLDRAAEQLNTNPTEVDRKVAALLEDIQRAEKEVAQLQRALARSLLDRLMDTNVPLGSTQGVANAGGVPVLVATVENATVDSMREMSDWFRDRVPSGVAALGTVSGDRPTLVVAVSPDLVDRGVRADKLIQPAARLIGGGGGGKATLSQAGGRDKLRLTEALALVPCLVLEMLEG